MVFRTGPVSEPVMLPVLGALQKIKAEKDSSFSYRRSYREGICGSCAMNIDGTNTMACLKPIDVDTSKPTVITYNSIASHVCDQRSSCGPDQFLPTVQVNRAMAEDQKSALRWERTPAERKNLDGLYECILCACCSTSCPSYWWNPEEFLLRLCCMLFERYPTGKGSGSDGRAEKIDRCRTIRNCTATCPNSLNPADAIQKMKAMHLFSQAADYDGSV
ncbi:Succinate dehydrogenase iron-sulfur subunit 3 [Hibiscus syriacus]|uniref:succinate dehydrogenase n=1 Tax=Hibiscus syriacus TaxID=106335 RepID=A0A6A3AE56_HIBSY|nr:Succinate dehydrogenase iron-sulfur subunit 3 [Hibiscus syriacus]